MAAAAVHSALLSRLPGIRHAFFTRRGGVSEGVYASLNGGTGSNDDQAKCARTARAWRRRSASAAPFPHLLSNSFARRRDRRNAMDRRRAPARRCDGDCAGRTRDRHFDRGLRTGAVRRREAQVIGGAHAGWRGAFTGVIEATIEGMEKLGAKRSRIRRRARPDDPARNYEVGPEFLARFEQADQENARFFTASQRAATQCSICPVTSRSACAMPASSKSTISASAPAATRTASIVTGA